MVSKNGHGANLTALKEASDRLLSTIDTNVARILDRALSGEDITVEEATVLFDAAGSANTTAIALAADDLRRRTVGDVVTYIINRNINFTDVCIKHCTFCAFSRTHREEEGYYLPTEEIVRRAREAWDLGATEICVQAGLPPVPGPTRATSAPTSRGSTVDALVAPVHRYTEPTGAFGSP